VVYVTEFFVHLGTVHTIKDCLTKKKLSNCDAQHQQSENSHKKQNFSFNKQPIKINFKTQKSFN